MPPLQRQLSFGRRAPSTASRALSPLSTIDLEQFDDHEYKTVDLSNPQTNKVTTTTKNEFLPWRDSISSPDTTVDEYERY
jgi:hypothetical protein